MAGVQTPGIMLIEIVLSESLEQEAEGTVRFGLDGAEYEIDLNIKQYV